jgi:ABC-type multidrug transport system fused ATPase/permease subunit
MCSAGSALSTGQKQLICFARVLLEPKKFLILDEATANIDHKTDEIIQAIIRSEFAGVTVISVAHRLSTIIDYDRIIVLSQGSIVEQGTAADLWREKGEFYHMIMSNPNESKAISLKIQSTSK